MNKVEVKFNSWEISASVSTHILGYSYHNLMGKDGQCICFRKTNQISILDRDEIHHCNLGKFVIVKCKFYVYHVPNSFIKIHNFWFPLESITYNCYKFVYSACS